MNQGWTYTDRVGANASGQTVLDFYTQRYPHSSREQWQQRIARSQILLNNQPITPQTRLATGQTLTYHRSPWQEPAAPLDFGVLYEDEDLWVIAKPSGLPVLPGGGFLEHTLLHQLRSRYPAETPVPVHRLGRGTSGAMLIAKSQSARVSLSKQFRVRTAQAISAPAISAARKADASANGSSQSDFSLGKVYRALIGPTQPTDLPERFRCDYPIGKLTYPGLSYLYGHSPGGSAAHSECRILQRRPEATLVEVSIATGRPHQIRIHLAAAGYPMLGDPLYGVGGTPIVGGSAMPGECGYLLHAHRLGFIHPRTGKAVCIEAEPPDVLKIREGMDSL
ncbi:MAG: pseudouridine synthase [Cyanobacteria bacterium J06634_5]